MLWEDNDTEYELRAEYASNARRDQFALHHRGGEDTLFLTIDDIRAIAAAAERWHDTRDWTADYAEPPADPALDTEPECCS